MLENLTPNDGLVSSDSSSSSNGERIFIPQGKFDGPEFSENTPFKKKIDVSPKKNLTENNIEIPPGKFGAPGDYRIIEESIPMWGEYHNIRLIEQTKEGNCAEYVCFNSAFILLEAGVGVLPSFKDYLETGTIEDIERGFVLPLLAERWGLIEDGVGGESVLEELSVDFNYDNLVAKSIDPRGPLTAVNSAILFKALLTPPDLFDFKPEEFKFNYSVDIDQEISGSELKAVFVGGEGHATCYLKIGPDCYFLDTTAPGRGKTVVTHMDVIKMKEEIKEKLLSGNYLFTLNDLYIF